MVKNGLNLQNDMKGLPCIYDNSGETRTRKKEIYRIHPLPIIFVFTTFTIFIDLSSLCHYIITSRQYSLNHRRIHT